MLKMDWSSDAVGVALAISLLSLPHWLYALVWLRPRSFRSVVVGCWRKHPVDVFASLAWGLKILQASVLLSWIYCRVRTATALEDVAVHLYVLEHISVERGAMAAVLIAIGQGLNLSIYPAIGHDGVYYGVRLGRKVPWHEGFPFSIAGFPIPHPQYLGSVMSLWALVLLLWNPATAPTIAVFAGAGTVFYTITGSIEQFC